MQYFRLFFSLVVFALSGCGMSSVISGANAIYHRNSLQHSASDFYIALRINNRIDSTPALAKQTISVTSFNHIVLLTGQTATRAQSQEAASIASHVPHVLKVFNAINVGNTTQNHVTNDAWITAKIKTQFIANNELDPSAIKVVTENGVVYLMGVITREQADMAVTIASNTSGVSRVVKIFYYVVMPRIN